MKPESYITLAQAINAAVNAWYGQLDDPGKELLLSMRHGAFLGQTETLEIVRCRDCDHGMQDCTPEDEDGVLCDVWGEIMPKHGFCHERESRCGENEYEDEEDDYYEEGDVEP